MFFRNFLTVLGMDALTTATSAEARTGASSPNRPQAFGCKINWFAIQADDPSAVAAALELTQTRPAHWSAGLEAACRYVPEGKGVPAVYITPPVEGWIFVIGSALPYPVMHTEDRHSGIGQAFDALFARLTERFTEVQFFGSYRVVDFVAWARASRGEAPRIFSYGDGEVFANLGPQTPEEAALGFPNLSLLPPARATLRIFDHARELDAKEAALVSKGLSRQEARQRTRQGRREPMPSEDDALELAGRWSLNPLKLPDQAPSPRLGLVAALPRHLMRRPQDENM